MSAFFRWLLRPLWRFWIEPIRAEPVAGFRILAGLVILWSVTASLGPRMLVDLGPDGLTPATAEGEEYHPDPTKSGSVDRWLHKSGKFCILRGFIGIPLFDIWLPRAWLGDFVPWVEAGGYWWLFGIYVASLVCVVLGLFTRISTFVAFLLTISFQARLSWVLNGGDAVMRDALFYMLLMPAGATWSIDAWLRGKKTGPTMIEAWSVRLAMIQICCIYFFTGLIKLGGTFAHLGAYFTALWFGGDTGPAITALLNEDWINGQAVYWVLNDNALNRVPYYWLPIPMKVCRLLSWGTILFEVGFPLFMLLRSVRTWTLVVGVFFHLGIWFHTEVGFFSPIMMAWYPLFLSGESLAWLVTRRKKPAPVMEANDESDRPPLEQVPAQTGIAIGERPG